jgi:hypothetical protein
MEDARTFLIKTSCRLIDVQPKVAGSLVRFIAEKKGEEQSAKKLKSPHRQVEFSSIPRSSRVYERRETTSRGKVRRLAENQPLW